MLREPESVKRPSSVLSEAFVSVMLLRKVRKQGFESWGSGGCSKTGVWSGRGGIRRGVRPRDLTLVVA